MKEISITNALQTIAVNQSQNNPMKQGLLNTTTKSTTARKVQRTIADLLTAAAIVLSVSPAGAGQPTIINVNDTWIDTGLSGCAGATIQGTAVGKLIIGENGDIETLSGPWKVTYLNLANGKSATMNESWHGITTDTISEDGLTRTLDTCSSGPLVIKDARGGVIWNESGRVCIHREYVRNGTRWVRIVFEVTVDTGRDDEISRGEALCQFLQ